MNHPHERRKHVRFLCSAVAEIHIKTGSDAGACHVGLINDICVKGMRLSMDGLIAENSEIVIRVPGKAEFTGTVRHVREEGPEYVVGIEFTIGEWDPQSDWPRHRWQPGQVHDDCEACADTRGREVMPGASEAAR